MFAACIFEAGRKHNLAIEDAGFSFHISLLKSQ